MSATEPAARVRSCPACGVLLAGRPHCYSAACTWVRCSCTAVIDTAAGRHYRIEAKGKA